MVKLKGTFFVGTEYAVKLHKEFCLNAKAEVFKQIFSMFIPICDNNCVCFKIINKHHLDHIKDKV